jgi:outer membrane receptor protein involved in Fe transport
MTPLLTPNERVLLYGIGRYDFTDGMRLEATAAFAYVGSRLAANQPNYAYTEFGLSSAYEDPQPGSAWLISPQNAFLDPQARGVLAAEGLTDFYLSRSNYDATPSPIASFVRTVNLNAVLSGHLRRLRRRFDWNVSYSHGQAYSSFSEYGFVYGNPAYRVPNLLGLALDWQDDTEANLQAPVARLAAANQLPLSIPSSTIHDFDVLYRFDRRFRVTLHIDNVFGEAPPQPWVYGADVLGRMIELSFRARLE